MQNYSEVSECAALQPHYSDSKQYSTRKLKSTVSKSGKNMALEATNLETWKRLISEDTGEWLTFSPVDFLAKTFQGLEKCKGLPGTEAAFGDIFTEQSRKQILDLQLLKTPKCSRRGDSTEWYANLPKSGMSANGKLYRLPSLEQYTAESGFIFLPTPMHTDGRGFYRLSREAADTQCSKRKNSHWIHRVILLYDFPKAEANPRFSEWMMGLADDYTRLDGLAR